MGVNPSYYNFVLMSIITCLSLVWIQRNKKRHSLSIITLASKANLMEPRTSPPSSSLQDESNTSNSLLTTSFNLILPSRPSPPLPLGETSYLELAGLFDESFTHDESLNNLTLPLSPSLDDLGLPLSLFPDNTEPLEAIAGSGFDLEASGPLSTLPVNETLEQQLRSAVCQHIHKESKGFLPLDKLKELVIEQSVAIALKECMPHMSLDDAQFYAQTICLGSLRNPLQSSFRRIFAILAMIQQPQEVLTFIENNITDHELPLLKVRGEKRGRFELRRRFQPHRTLECLDKWSPFWIDSFEGCQWMMLSPFFSWGNRRTVRTYFLADQTILPFIEDSSHEVSIEDDEDFQGGHGSISKVKIHPAHHDFHHMAVCIKFHLH